MGLRIPPKTLLESNPLKSSLSTEIGRTTRRLSADTLASSAVQPPREPAGGSDLS